MISPCMKDLTEDEAGAWSSSDGVVGVDPGGGGYSSVELKASIVPLRVMVG